MRHPFTLVFVAISVLSFLTGFSLVRHRTKPIPVNPQAESKSPDVRILRIPSIGVTLPIIPAQITDGMWQTTDKGISHAATTPAPGTTGNSVLYGHNWPNLFGNLTKIKPGDEITVHYGGNSVTYMVRFTAIVDPGVTSVFTATNDTRLTVYTCTGFLDAKRFVVTAIKT